MRFKKGQYHVVEDIGRGNGMFTGIELGKGYPAISVNKSLLVNAAYALNSPYIISVLGP